MKTQSMLRAGLTADRNSASGRKGATRWSIYDGEVCYENWIGDIVRFMPEAEWCWQPRAGEDISGRDPYQVARAAGIAPPEGK